MGREPMEPKPLNVGYPKAKLAKRDSDFENVLRCERTFLLWTRRFSCPLLIFLFGKRFANLGASARKHRANAVFGNL